MAVSVVPIALDRIHSTSPRLNIDININISLSINISININANIEASANAEQCEKVSSLAFSQASQLENLSGG